MLREILEAGSARKEGLPPKPNAKILLAYVRGVDNVLSTFEIRMTSCRNVLEPEQIEAVPEQSEALESRFASRDVLANLPAGFRKI